MTQVTDGEAERSRTVRKVWLPLPSPAHGPSNARAFVRGALSCWDVGEASMADVAHVASELVALAFRLRAQSLELELDLDEEFVHVRVRGTANDEATDDS